VAWDRLNARLDPAGFTITTVPRRIRDMADPWADYWSARQRLPGS
jgi:DNA primase